MGIGAGIFLIALGAIMAFAVDWHVGGLDIQVVGWVLMLSGVAGIILFFTFWNRRQARRVVERAPTVVEQAPTVVEQDTLIDRGPNRLV